VSIAAGVTWISWPAPWVTTVKLSAPCQIPHRWLTPV
jgi:hypothetical protein